MCGGGTDAHGADRSIGDLLRALKHKKSFNLSEYCRRDWTLRRALPALIEYVDAAEDRDRCECSCVGLEPGACARCANQRAVTHRAARIKLREALSR